LAAPVFPRERQSVDSRWSAGLRDAATRAVAEVARTAEPVALAEPTRAEVRCSPDSRPWN